MALVKVRQFTLAGVPIPGLEFLVGGSENGDETVGLLGQNVLGFADVEYDLANGVIRLFDAKGCAGKSLAYWDTTRRYSDMAIVAPTPEAPHTRADVFVNGVKLRAMFDTGAGDSTLTVAGSRRAGIDLRGPKVVSGGLIGGIGRGQAQSWIVPVQSFKVGQEEIQHTRLRVADTRLFEDAEMLVGADFFLSHRVYVSKDQRKLYFTYNGGPVFNLEADPAAASSPVPAPSSAASAGQDAAPAPPPRDAESVARRAAAESARREFTQAIADFDRAHALAPDEPRYLYQRGMTRWQAGDTTKAKADFDGVLALRPDDTQSLMARARLALAEGPSPAASADIDRAAGLLDAGAQARLELADLYVRAEAYARAISQFDLWLKFHPADTRRAEALNGRCWARAVWGQELPLALADCNGALKLIHDNASILDSRGLVHLRRGDLDLAIADYDTALAWNPRIAWSLYGRGVAKTRKGLSADGARDIAAAVALDAKLPDKARRAGLEP